MGRKKKGKLEIVPLRTGCVLGLDLGTDYSVIAELKAGGEPRTLVNAEGSEFTDSVANCKDETSILIGSIAVNKARFEPEYTARRFKRQMGKVDSQGNPIPVLIHPDTGNAQTSVTLSSCVVRKLVQDAEDLTGKEVSGVVITVPAYFEEAARLATKRAGELAGVNVLQIADEPTAAAVAFGLDKGEDGTFVIYDIGGGTCDVSIVGIEGDSITVIATDGDRDLGGGDIDDLILAKVTEQFQVETGITISPEKDLVTWYDVRERCERAKKDLSSAETASIMVAAEGKRLVIDLTREDFDVLIAPIVGKTKAIVERAMSAAKLKWSQINDVILVGGSTRIPAIRKMLKDLSGKEPRIDIVPDHAVALGAAAIAAKVASDGGMQIVDANGQKVLPPPLEVTGVNAHSLGVLAVNSRTGHLRNVVLIEKNTPLPAEKEDTFQLEHENQSQAQITVVQGEHEADPEDCMMLGEMVIRDLPPGPVDAGRIQIKYTLSTEAILGVSATDTISGQRVEATIKRALELNDQQQ